MGIWEHQGTGNVPCLLGKTFTTFSSFLLVTFSEKSEWLILFQIKIILNTTSNTPLSNEMALVYI